MSTSSCLEVILDRNAGTDAMLHLLIKGGFYHAGQVCVSV